MCFLTLVFGYNMEKRSFISLMFAICSLGLWSQKKSDFNIIIPDVKVENSVYSDLRYIESRPDPGVMGIVYVNQWNGVQGVTLFESLEEQINNIKQIVPQSEPSTMAVQMRVLFFGFGKGKNKDKSVCNLRITLYEADSDDKYYFLNTIDTLIVAESKEIRPAAGNAISSFIIENLPYHTVEGEESLDMQQVMDINMYERNSIPFFVEDKIPDGIYYTYRSLKNLTPDDLSPLNITKVDGDKIKEVKIPDPEKAGKEKKLKIENVYAIVHDGYPYIGFEGDYYQAYKKDMIWSFNIMRKVAGSGFSIGIGMGGGNRNFGGGVGFGIPVGGKKEKVEVFIDHLNGDLY